MFQLLYLLLNTVTTKNIKYIHMATAWTIEGTEPFQCLLKIYLVVYIPAARAVTPPTATINLFWSVSIARKPPIEH